MTSLSPALHDTAGSALLFPSRTRWDPSAYRNVAPQHQHVEARKLLSLHLHEFSGREKILDIGCGDGSFTLTQLYPMVCVRGGVVGVDKDPSMIAHARSQRGLTQYVSNLRFSEADVRDLSGIEGSFHLVFTNAALHHLYRLEDQALALRQIRSKMERGSVLLASFAGHGNFQGLVESCERVITMPEWRLYFNDFTYPLLRPTPQQYKIPLLENRLCPVNLSLDPHSHYYASQHELEDFVRVCLRSVMCRIEHLSEADQRRFAASVVREYVTSSPQAVTQRGVALTSVNLVLKAVAI